MTYRNGNAGKTHCKHGHEFTPENTYIAPDRSRNCRTCGVERTARYKAARINRPGQVRAWRTLAYERERGRMLAQPCVECGEPLTHAHHPNGYEGDAMWDIVWLCALHHRAAHRRAS